MNIVIILLIASGIVIMLSNIIRYGRFMRKSRDVLSTDKPVDRLWGSIGLALLLFFLCAYIWIAVLNQADILMALVLFGGSIFVMIVLTLMFRLIDTAKERSIHVADVLIGVIEARDPNLNGHSRYVRNLTMLFFKYLPEKVKKGINVISLEYAALLHDVGKLGIPESVLNKPGKLNEQEWALIKQHPKIGVRILEPLKSFQYILPWIEYHHERIDGKGYYGLPEQEIPVAARIIAIADTYSAITMKRSYKPPKSHEEAIAILKEVAGTQLDAKLVDLFCGIPGNELLKCAPEYLEI